MNAQRKTIAGGHLVLLLPELLVLKWQVGPGGEGVLEQLLSGEGRGAEVLKERSGRIVVLCKRPFPRAPEGIIVKRYLEEGGLKYLQMLLGRSKGAREWSAGVLAWKYELPVARPLAYGFTGRLPEGPTEALVLEYLEGAETLETVFPRRRQGRRALPLGRKKRVLEALACMVRRLHDAGAVHRDLHAANILVRRPFGESPEAYLIDLDGLKFGRRLSLRRRAVELGRLDAAIGYLASRTDRLRFLRAYLEACGEPLCGSPEESRAFARAVEAERHARLVRFRRGRIKRYLRARGRLAGVKTKYGYGLAVRSPLEELGREGVSRLLRHAYETAPWISADGVRVARFTIGRTGFLVWRYEGHARGRFLGRRAARRAWIALWNLRIRHVSIPEPVCFMLVGLRERKTPDLLVTLEDRKLKPLERVLERTAGRPREKAVLARALGGAFRKIVEAGYVLDAVRLEDILVAFEGGAPAHVVPLRPDRVRPIRRERDPEAMLLALSRDVRGRPEVTLRDTIRFVRAYLGPARAQRGGWKFLWRKLAAD